MPCHCQRVHRLALFTLGFALPGGKCELVQPLEASHTLVRDADTSLCADDVGFTRAALLLAPMALGCPPQSPRSVPLDLLFRCRTSQLCSERVVGMDDFALRFVDAMLCKRQGVLRTRQMRKCLVVLTSSQ
jgi:hypothetical protein